MAAGEYMKGRKGKAKTGGGGKQGVPTTLLGPALLLLACFAGTLTAACSTA